MKKILMLLIVVTLVAVSVFAFSGCTTTSVPGVAWGTTETFVYDIYDSDQDDAVVGTLTYSVELLPLGEYTIDSIADKTFSVTETVSKGARITMSAVDTDGVVMMYSEALTNGFSSLASYKEVSYGDTSYSYSAYYYDSRCYYSINGSDYADFKSSTDIDTSSLYNLIRGYDLGSGYSASIEVVNPTDASTESFYLSTSVDSELTATINYNTTDFGSGSIDVDTYMVTLTKNNAPIGGSIIVYYSAYDSSEKSMSSSSFFTQGSQAVQSSSFHIPVRIEENNLTYVLSSATFA